MDSEAAGRVDEFGLKVPGVDDDVARSGVLEQLGDLVVIRFGLRERVVEDDVDVSSTLVFASISATTTRSRYSSNRCARPFRTTS